MLDLSLLPTHDTKNPCFRQLLAIETDVKQAVRILEERIARRESAEAALKKWRRQLPPKVHIITNWFMAK